jgi:hypothetical protein
VIGNTQQYERELALVRQTRDNSFPVIPVLMPGCENPPTGFQQLLNWIDLSRDNTVLEKNEGLQPLCGAINRQAVPPSALRMQVCPYRGLEARRAISRFGPTEADYDIIRACEEARVNWIKVLPQAPLGECSAVGLKPEAPALPVSPQPLSLAAPGAGDA